MDSQQSPHSLKQLEIAKTLAALLGAILQTHKLTEAFTLKPTPLAYGSRVQVGADGKLGPFRSTIELDLRQSQLSLTFIVSGHVALTCPLILTPAQADAIQLGSDAPSMRPIIRALEAILPKCLDIIRITHPYSLKANP